MKMILLIALAKNAVLSMENDVSRKSVNHFQKLSSITEYQVADFLPAADRKQLASTSKSYRQVVLRHSMRIDSYIGLFDYQIQAANGCITGNKLRNLDPVVCIKSIANPPQRKGLAFHAHHSFSNVELETLIFNAITVKNILVLEELLRLLLTTGKTTFEFLLNAYFWALMVPKYRWHFTSLEVDSSVFAARNLIVEFASVNDFHQDFSEWVWVGYNDFQLAYSKSDEVLTNLVFKNNYEDFKKYVDSKRTPIYLSLKEWYRLGLSSHKYLEYMLEKGAIVASYIGSICAATNYMDKESLQS